MFSMLNESLAYDWVLKVCGELLLHLMYCSVLYILRLTQIHTLSWKTSRTSSVITIVANLYQQGLCTFAGILLYVKDFFTFQDMQKLFTLKNVKFIQVFIQLIQMFIQLLSQPQLNCNSTQKLGLTRKGLYTTHHHYRELNASNISPVHYPILIKQQQQQQQ